MAITPGEKCGYPQLRRDFTRDVRPGDELRVSVWVRSQGVDGAPGASMALEFLDEGGIAHSKTSETTGARGWEQLVASGTALSSCRAR